MLDDTLKIEYSNSEMFYIMTSYGDWDKYISSYYFRFQIKYFINDCVNYTPTFFLKINKTNKKIERSWKGKIFSIKAVDRGAIVEFSFKTESPVKIVSDFKPLEIGWYIIKSQKDLQKIKL